MSQGRRLAVIGPGKVGSAVAGLAARYGYDVVLGARDLSRAKQIAQQLGSGIAVAAAPAAVRDAGLVLLTVNDDAIAGVCESLASGNAFAAGQCVAHVSGALSSAALESARRRGCHVASAHPLQTFPSSAAALRSLPGAYWFVEGDPCAVREIERLTASFGAQVVPIEPGKKAHYHASAVMACNYLITLLDNAFELAACAGVDRALARRALAPLVQSSLDNVINMGTGAALTGPVVRGDVNTVKRHFAALKGNRRLLELYTLLGLRTVDLAVASGRLEETDAELLRGVFDARPEQDA